MGASEVNCNKTCVHFCVTFGRKADRASGARARTPHAVTGPAADIATAIEPPGRGGRVKVLVEVHTQITLLWGQIIGKSVDMSLIAYRHGMTADEARDAIEQELRKLGYGDYVKWNGPDVSARVGMGVILNLHGGVTNETVIVDTCGGAAGGRVLSHCRQIVTRIFPNGGELTG